MSGNHQTNLPDDAAMVARLLLCASAGITGAPLVSGRRCRRAGWREVTSRQPRIAAGST